MCVSSSAPPSLPLLKNLLCLANETGPASTASLWALVTLEIKEQAERVAGREANGGMSKRARCARPAIV